MAIGACSSSPAAPPGAAPATAAPATSTTVATTAPGTSSTSSTLPVPPPAPPVAAYDNAVAARACTLLSAQEIQAQFGAVVAEGVPIYPYCWWKVGDNGFVSLTIFDKKPISVFRSYTGLNVGNIPDVGESAFFASNKTLFIGVAGTTYNLQFERGAEWVDANRPRLIALSQFMLDRLGFVPPPKPTTTTTTALPPPTNPDDPTTLPTLPPPTVASTSTTTTTRPKPPVVAPPAALVAPTAPIDVGRPLSAEAPLKIWVGGDSIAGGPAWAVGEAAKPTGVASVDTEFQVGTGLARPDFFDWYRHLAAVADARDPDVMILLFGGNDIQPLDLPAGGSVSYGQPGWLDEYRRRVGQIMDTLAVRGRHVIWAGTPPMEDSSYNEKMAALNEIYQTEAAKHAPWVTYFDAWTMFSPPGEPGKFVRELPDANGVPQKVRFDDIHYDIHGSELLAVALLAEVRRFTKLPG
jgi:hypothetical protein